jgi:hypothetical protein
MTAGDSTGRSLLTPIVNRAACSDDYDGMHSVVEPEAKLYNHLPVIDLIIFNVASGFDDLKPVDVVQCLAGLGNCVLYRIFDASFRSAGQLDLFVDMLAHMSPRGLVVALLKTQ